MDPRAGAQALAEEVKQALYLFNVMSIFIDVIPFLIICYVPRLETANRYFSVRSFILGAGVNFMLVCHIIFALNPMEHMDKLFVAMAGLFLGTACAFLCLLHRVAVDRSRKARHLMSLLIISLLLGSFAILHGIGENFRADEGFGILISGLAIIGAVLLNGIPHLQNMLGCVAVEPDIAVDGFGMLTSFLNTVDSCFLVAYAQIVIGKLGSLFSIISTITAVSSLVQFFIFLGRMQG